MGRWVRGGWRWQEEYSGQREQQVRSDQGDHGLLKELGDVCIIICIMGLFAVKPGLVCIWINNCLHWALSGTSKEGGGEIIDWFTHSFNEHRLSTFSVLSTTFWGKPEEVPVMKVSSHLVREADRKIISTGIKSAHTAMPGGPTSFLIHFFLAT